jgi:hypothetical protein
LADIVWVAGYPRNGFEFAVDLHECRRLFIPGEDEDECVRTSAYLTKDGKWIVEAELYPPDPLDRASFSQTLAYAEWHPIDVAHLYMRVHRQWNRYMRNRGRKSEDDIRLPAELEEYRQVASDENLYHEWQASQFPSKKKLPDPRWDRSQRTLWLGKECIRKVSTQACNQLRVLDALQSKGWPNKSIINPLKDIATLRQTVKDFNRAGGRGNRLSLVCNGDRVWWRLQDQFRRIP